MKQNVLGGTSTNDPVTGLYSMYNMLGKMEKSRREALEINAAITISVIYINIEKFKLYNSYYGMKQGNTCLKQVGEILRDTFDTDMVSRFSDDHFVVLYVGKDVTKRVKAAHDAIQYINENFRLQIAVGIYPWRDDVSSNIACDCAKIACDEAKDDAVYYYREYTQELQEDLKLRKYITDNIDKAIANGWIKIYYQPVVRTLTQKLCGMEALTRWIDPVHGYMPPAVFVPVLEKYNLIYRLDLYVIHSIAQHLYQLKQLGQPVMPVSVNISRMDFTIFNPCDEINGQIMKYGLLREWFNVEITETTIMNDPEKTRSEISRFHNWGIQVWMDDFGSGYSSLNLLKDFDFDEIKIDLAFMKGMNEKSKHILKNIITMAKELSIHTLAEGVETREQFNFLRSLGCERIQGYYFGKPEPYQDMMQHLRQRQIPTETRLERNFFDKIGNTEFVTNQAMELLYYSHGRLRTLFMNDTYQLQRFGTVTDDFSIIDARRERDISATYHNILWLVNSTTQTGKVQSTDLIYDGRYYRVTMQLLNKNREGSILLSTSMDITRDAKSEAHAADYDWVLRHLLSVYQEIYVRNFEQGTIKVVASKYYASQQEGETLPALLLDEVFIQKNVYFQDQQIFREFMQKDNMLQRLHDCRTGNLSEVVRLRAENGSYRWMRICIIAPPAYESKSVIMTIQPSLLDEESKAAQIFSRVMSTDIAADNEHINFLKLSSYWRTLMERTKIKFFWKDSKRRFLGVSQAFLDFYHFHSETEVIGKTDEEIGFNLDDKGFRQCEEEVLQQGRIIQNNVGKNIVDGVERNITNSKFPVYENGKIIGLIGYFFDANDMFPEYSKVYQSAFIDKVTGFMNLAGFFVTLALYHDQWRLDQRRFSLTLWEISTYDTVYQSYGPEIAEKLMQKTGRILSRDFGNNQIIARISARRFVMLKRGAEEPDFQQKWQQCVTEVEAIHKIDDYSCTVFIACGRAKSEESHSLYELIRLADSRLKLVSGIK